MSLLFEDKELGEVIIAHQGIVYGGYIRDMIAKVEPTDIDVIIYLKNEVKFEKKMKEMGYTVALCAEHETSVYTKEGKKPVEVSFVLYDPILILVPPIWPDYDVNTLMWNGSKILSWTNPYLDIGEIKEHIANRGMLPMDDDVPENRLYKMLDKGYEILESDR